MSLVVSFEGRLRPYGPKEPEHTFSVQKAERTKPIVEDVFGELVRDDKMSHHENDWHPHSLNSNIKTYQKNAQNFARQFYARDIMHKHVIALAPEQTIQDALNLLAQNSFRHLPIIKGEVMIGIISDRLLFQKLAAKSSYSTSLESIMVRNIITALPQTNIVEIARAMMVEKISCLPVTDEELHLKGIITTSDLLKVIVQKLPFSNRA